MFRRIKSRINRDDGNATIVLGIMLIVCLIVVGGMMLDFSKAQHLKSSYVDAAKKATQSATMKVNSRGYLKSESIGVAISNYETVMRPDVVNTDGYFSKCENYDEDDVELTITLTERDNLGNIIQKDDFSIMRSQVGMGSPDYINSMVPSSIKSKIDDRGSFRPTEIQLNVTEGTENTVLPTGFKLTKNPNSDGMKCQKLEIAAKATIFLGDEGDRFD